ncbi:hypothetical protein GcM3_089023, partial [Golovinomyces cichoracearum]
MNETGEKRLKTSIKNEEKYYGRAQEQLRRDHARDERIDWVTTLSPTEAVMLSVVVSAFLNGINDDQVRTTVLMRSTSISKSLCTAYEAAEDVRSSLERLQEVERERDEKRELEAFRSRYSEGWNRPLNSDLAGLDRRRDRMTGPEINIVGQQRLQTGVASRNWESQTNRQPEAYYNQRQNQMVP